MTTGLFDGVLVNYCQSLDLPVHITFVKNPFYQNTNYIYSIYCAREYLDDDIILMHGDLVFENAVFDTVLSSVKSCIVVSSTKELPEKDFKAVIRNGHVEKIGIEYFHHAMAAQPLYRLRKNDWKIWLNNIIKFCESDNVKCYAENAFNEVSNTCMIYPLDIKDMLCGEIDDLEDLAVVDRKSVV